MSITISKNNKSLDKIQDYWTEERRNKAIPKIAPLLPNQHITDSDLPLPSKPIATPRNTSINDADQDQVITTRLATPVKNPTQYPWSCNGKLFFTWKGKDYVGSAGSILLEVLLTAGHNIYDEGEWSDNFLYYPSYPDLKTSYGWSRVAIFTAWKNNTNYALDYAMILLNTPLPISIGSIGVVRDINPKDKTWTAIAYPAEPPYDGKKMYKTTGEYVSGNTIITMNNNDMTQGSSGGNWIIKIDGDSYVNGVQSTRGVRSDYANSPYIANSDYTALLSCVTTNTCK